MNNNSGIFISTLNFLLAKIQGFFAKFDFSKSFANVLDKLVFLSIIVVIIGSLFASSDMLGAIAFITFCLTVLKMFVKSGEKFELNKFETFVLFWFLFVIVSLFGSSLFALSLKGFSKTVIYMGFFFSAVQFYRKNFELIFPTMLLIGGCAFFEGCVGIYQHYHGVDAISTWQDTSYVNPEDVMTRVYGTIKPFNPNLYGGYLVAVIPALFAPILFLSNKKYVTVSIFALAISSIALISSGCRGSYIALFFALLCFVLYCGKIVFDRHNDFLKKLYIYIVSISSLISVSAAFLISSVRSRILSVFILRADSSTSFRMNVYQSAFQMIKDNWLFGIGVGNKNFREIYGLYMKTGFDALSTYNVFTELWVESGIFAFISYLLFLFFIIKAVIGYVHSRGKNQIIAVVALISILSVIVHGFFDTIYFRPQVQFIFWLMVAFVSACLYPENNESCKE